MDLDIIKSTPPTAWSRGGGGGGRGRKGKAGYGVFLTNKHHHRAVPLSKCSWLID